MQARYGAKWTAGIEGIEEVAIVEWGKGLADLTPEQIKRGLENWEGEWPPTLVEFKRTCLGKGKNGWGLDYVPECYRETRKDRLLEEGTRSASKDIVLANIRVMRKKCGAGYE